MAGIPKHSAAAAAGRPCLPATVQAAAEHFGCETDGFRYQGGRPEKVSLGVASVRNRRSSIPAPTVRKCHAIG